MEEVRKRFGLLGDFQVSLITMLMEMLGTMLFVLVGLLVAVYSYQETPLSGKTCCIAS